MDAASKDRRKRGVASCCPGGTVGRGPGTGKDGVKGLAGVGIVVGSTYSSGPPPYSRAMHSLYNRTGLSLDCSMTQLNEYAHSNAIKMKICQLDVE